MSTSAGGENYVSIPRGGPLYLQNTVGPVTRVPEFENAVFAELESLKAEIGWDAAGDEFSGEEFNVDDLKVLTEEELVSRAFAEAFNGNDDNAPEKKQKRRKRNTSNVGLEEGYVAKVQELARIKQKQDEDKKAARLHSFDGSKNQPAMSWKDKDKNNTAIRCSSSSANAKASYCIENVPILYPEVVISVEVYHYKRKTWQKFQEFLVLGQQYLTELKDKIYCLTDEMMNKEEQHDPSGYFLIEDVFCNDTRDPNATDYSKPIFQWLEQSQDEALEKWEYLVSGEQQMQQKKKAFLDGHSTVPLPRFKARDMQNVRFCNINFRLGAGYMYCHQGDCKHMVVFRDMRLIHPEDEQNRAAYPLIPYQAKLRIRKCSACNIYKATKITVDDKWAKDNPCYFCDLCYYMLHYQDESLLYDDFSVFDYFHE